MIIYVNDVKIADNISSGTSKDVGKNLELTLISYDNTISIYTVDKDARVDVESSLSETGEIVTVKSTEQQLQEAQEENNQLKERIQLLEQSIFDLSDAVLGE